MKTTFQGKKAEQAVADKLVNVGFEILGQNWKTRICEIDVIAKKNRIIYFVEVKFRSSSAHGTGFEYITPAKQRQMLFAAEIWNQQNNWDGDYRLIGAAVEGSTFENIKLVEL